MGRKARQGFGRNPKFYTKVLKIKGTMPTMDSSDFGTELQS
jgi:hypothetical protein